MRDLADDFPGLFTGLVFGTVAFASSLIVTSFYILILRRDGLIASGAQAPFDAYLFLYILLLPALITLVTASLLGRKLLSEFQIDWIQAGKIGATIAALSFFLWAAAGELLWIWIDFPAPNPADSGVVNFLVVLGYALMSVVFLVVVGLGAAVGVGLRSWSQGA